MNLNIKATKTTLTPSIQQILSQKLAALEKFLRPEDKIYAEFEVDKKHKSGLVFRVEIKISPKNCYADSRGNDFYEALDLVIPKIKEQLVKGKDKRVSTRRRFGGRKRA